MIRTLNKALIIFFIATVVLSIIGWQDADNSSPQDIFEIYKKALAEADIKTYMDCITQDSKQMLSQRPPQSSRMIREYQDITGKNYKVTIEDTTAILEFEPMDAIAPPYFLKKENGKWKIDLKRMSEEILFDQNNHWYWHRKESLAK